jgi:hypothetical protein
LLSVKASLTFHAPHRSVVVAFIRLVIQKAVSMSPSGISRSGERAPVGRSAPPRSCTVLSVETPDPFGFGSGASARPTIRPSDTPGPGNTSQERVISISSPCEDMASASRPSPRANPSTSLDFETQRPALATLHASTAASDRRSASIRSTGAVYALRTSTIYRYARPGSYSLRLLRNGGVTSVFKSRSERKSFPGRRRQPPRFDGRTFLPTRSDYQPTR